MMKKIFLVVVILICLGSVSVILYLVIRATPRKPINLSNPPASSSGSLGSNIKKPSVITSAIISFNPSGAILEQGNNSEIKIMINPGDKELVGVNLKIIYDPNLLGIKSITPGNYFKDQTLLQNTIDPKGVAILAIGSLKPSSGNGVLATLSVIPKSRTSKKPLLVFDKKETLAGGMNGEESIIKELIDGIYEIK